MIKILLLEDDYLYRVSIKEFLEELDFHVDDFENGDDAFDAIFENYYDLLLLDAYNGVFEQCFQKYLNTFDKNIF